MGALTRTSIVAAIVVRAFAEAQAAQPPPDGTGTAIAETPPDNEHYALRAELGLELDTNAHRVETVSGMGEPAVRSLLQRMVLAGTLFDTVAPGHAVALTATAAGKYFDDPAARGENVAVGQSSAAWRMALGERTRLIASGVYYEAFQRASTDPVADAERRDFRSLIPTLQLGWLAGETVDLTATAGWRWLTFKPNRDYDFTGPTAAVDARWAIQQDAGPDWETGAGAALEHRDFAGFAYRNCGAELPCLGTEPRVDDLVLAHVEVTRTAELLLGAGYAFQYNRSNSLGETVTRHYAILRGATQLPFGLSLVARAELLFAFYRDRVHPSAGSAYISIEDENRSSVRADLSRDLGEKLRLYARYTLYVNELGASAIDYNRQTFLLSLAFTLEK